MYFVGSPVAQTPAEPFSVILRCQHAAGLFVKGRGGGCFRGRVQCRAYIWRGCAGRRAMVTLPNDPDLVDILAKNGVDISVSEGEQQVPEPPSAESPSSPHGCGMRACMKNCDVSPPLHSCIACDVLLKWRCLRSCSRATMWRCWAICCSRSSPLPAYSSCSGALAARADRCRFQADHACAHSVLCAGQCRS